MVFTSYQFVKNVLIPNKSKNKKAFSTIFLSVLLFLASFFYLWQQSNKTALHDDEIMFVGRSYFLDHYLQADFQNKIWKSFDSYDVPKFGEFSYALLLKSYFNFSSSKEYLSQTNFYNAFSSEEFLSYLNSKGYEKDEVPKEFNSKFMNTEWADFLKFLREEKHTSISEFPETTTKNLKTIFIARKLAVIIAFLNLFLVFLICSKMKNITQGIICIIMLIFNKSFITISTRAMGDGFFLMTILSSFILSQKIIEDYSIKKKFNTPLLLSLGIIIGIGISSKLNAGLALIYFSSLILILIFKNKILINKGIVAIIITTITSYLTFLLLNPFTWTNPIKNSLFMIQHRIEVFKIQQLYFPDIATITLKTKVINTIKSVFFANTNMLWGLILLLSAVLGFSFILKKYLKFKNDFFKLSLLLLTVVIAIPTIIFLPLNWLRYYYPIIILVNIFSSYSFVKLLKKIRGN